MLGHGLGLCRMHSGVWATARSQAQIAIRAEGPVFQMIQFADDYRMQMLDTIKRLDDYRDTVQTLKATSSSSISCHHGADYNAVERQVGTGSNKGKSYFVCGKHSDKGSSHLNRCEFFRWKEDNDDWVSTTTLNTSKWKPVEPVTSEIVDEAWNCRQNSDAWHEYRRGRITASSFGGLFPNGKPCHVRYIPEYGLCDTTTGARLDLYKNPHLKTCVQTLRQLLWGLRYDNEAMRWGHMHEPTALEAYRQFYAEAYGHENVSLTRPGICLSEKWPFMGASPDAIMHIRLPTGIIHKLVEVKCPFKRMQQKAFSPPYQPTEVEPGLVLPMHPEYYAQTQATMHLLAQAGHTNLMEMDVVTWSPACMTITKLCHSPAYCDQLIQAIDLFYHQVFLPAQVDYNKGLIQPGDVQP